MGGSSPSPLVTDAAMVRLDIYGPSAQCVDGQLAAGAGAPIQSQTFAQGQPIKLDVPPGPHAIVLSTFADTDGTQLLGIGCTEADLSAGSQICFDLTIEPAPDGGDDLSGAICTTSPDDCPAGTYCDGLECVPGCKSDRDCPQNDAGAGVCDPTTHTCENCVSDKDCGGMPGAACCNRHCTNTNSDPQNCSVCGMACTGSNNACCGGACTNPLSDADNCGGCGMVCSANHMSTRTCGGGSCNGACAAGFGDCNNNKLTDGCETNTNTTTTSCGACGTNCNTLVKNATGILCNAGSCDYGSCASASFKDCNGVHADGCEVNIGTDVSNCGACGRACSTANVTNGLNGLSCAGGLCNTTSCNSGTGNCAQPAAPAPDDGCEQSLHDVNHCGTCTNVCSYANAGASCPAGTCGIGACNAGFFNCDGNTANGCEAPGYDFGGGKGCCSSTTPATSGSPMIAHNNGLSRVAPAGTPTTFYDCYPIQTPAVSPYPMQLALDAANQSSFANAMYPAFTTTCNVSGASQAIACIDTPTIGICWAYTGTTTKLGNPPASFPAGYVDFNNTPGDTSGHPALENYYCPSPDYTTPAGGDPSWQ